MKDGTIYLAFIHYKSELVDFRQWELIRWGKPVGLSSEYPSECWLNQKGFALKNFTILFTERLDSIIMNMRESDDQLDFIFQQMAKDEM